jgi:hypothetical protein
MSILKVIRLFLLVSLCISPINCQKQKKNIKVVGEDVVFIFDNKNKNLININITGNDELKAKPSGAFQKNKRPGDYFVSPGGKQIWFNPSDSKGKSNGVTFNYHDSLFSAEISWKILFNDAAIIEFSVIPKHDFKNISMGMEVFNILPGEVKNIYCLPFSLPYFRKENENRIPDRWISNGETLNNTFSLITAEATYSLSVVPSEFRLDNKLNADAAQDYLVYFGIDEERIDTNSFTIEKSAENEKYINNAGSILVKVNHPFEVKKGDTIQRQFIIHVSKETGQYTTGKHIGEYMAYVPYKKECNSMDLYLKSMDYLLENKNSWNTSDQYGDNYWGAVHSQTGAPFGNGTAYYAMYGNSFSIAALNQFSKMGSLKEQEQKRLQGVKQFLTTSGIQNKDGSYWSMMSLDGEKDYVDQAYRKWIQTHATAWICYYLLESYEITGDVEILSAARKSLAWLIRKQRTDGSFPKYIDNGKDSKENQGDIGWNALAFFKAAELKVMPENNFTSEQLVQHGIKAVDWICDSRIQEKRFYGSFEDVGGVVDSYASTVCARAAIKAFQLTNDEKYLNAGKSILTISLAWVTCDFNKRGDKDSWAKDKEWQPAYGQVESTTCYYPCSYTLPMLYLASTEYAGIAPEKEKLFWLKIARNMSHLSKFFNHDVNSASVNGMEWRLFPFLVFSEWGNSQTCWAILESLMNRFHLRFPGIGFTADLKAKIDGENVKLIINTRQEGAYCIVDPEVDYLVMKSQETNKAYLALLAEGTATERVIRFGEDLLATICGNCEQFHLFDPVNHRSLGVYSKQELILGIKIFVDQSIILEVVNA